MSRKTPTSDVLDDARLREIALRGGGRSWAAQTLHVTEEDESDVLYILLSGRAKVYGAGDDSREVVYATQGPGEYFGEMMLDGGRRSASVMTLEPSTCAVVPGPQVRDFLSQHPDFALHVIRKLIRLARASTEHVKNLALEDVHGRLARLLRSKARDEGGVLMLPERLTQQDLAEHVGTSREMVCRVFKPLPEGGYIEMRGGRIAVLKKLPAGL